MIDRLGELLQHYRPASGLGRALACGGPSGCVTSVLEEVGCPDCKAVTERAAELAGTCGCRVLDTHLAVARMHIQEERAARSG